MSIVEYEHLLNALRNDLPLNDVDKALYRRDLAAQGCIGSAADHIMRSMEDERQDRVRDSLRSHGPWGGER